MAVLPLTKLWINLLATGEALSAPTADRGLSVEVGGEVRTYAGGRQRYVGRDGVQSEFTVTLRKLTLSQVATLQAWAGSAVQLRDHRGQIFTAVYSGVQVAEYKTPLYYDAAITARTITVTDGV